MASRVFGRLTSQRTYALAVVVCLAELAAAPVSAAPCATARLAPQGHDRAHVLVEADAYVAALRYPEARAMFSWMLKHNPKDRDARFAVARLDAWERCFERAAVGYRALLKAAPTDLEARAGLADVLLWDARWDEARSVIDEGLRLEPARPELWLRRARLLLWSGDVVRAVAAADHAEELAPNDGDVRALRDGIFLGQLRAGLRADVFVGNYPNIYTSSLSGLQRWRAFDFLIDAQGIDRIGGNEPHPILDGRYALGAIYRATSVFAAGLSLGFGAPHPVVPQYEAKASVWLSIGTRWTGSLSYALWHYHSDKIPESTLDNVEPRAPDKTAHIIAPSIAYALTDDLQLEARAWISGLRVQEPTRTKWAVAAGVRAIWHALTPLRLMPSYTYGPQFDQTPGSPALLGLDSHVFGLAADWLVVRHWGLVPALGYEHRLTKGQGATKGHSVEIFSAELSSYVRW